ncbi:telomere length regulation protein [[Emmonsia] crescens]|uniref:Telomere length regulation protein n=1 Tax=[Emmonsia] crescens TaxID=73230 RepID=A0A2B7ZBH4_9EURO|nr:telomere length regulation protein [Emmonsia crescens]
MDELLIAVKTVGNREELTVSQPPRPRESSSPPQEEKGLCQQIEINSLEEALQALKSSPDKHHVVQVLAFLDPSQAPENGFNITTPSALAAQILHSLITTTIPDHWSSLGNDNTTDPEGGHKHKPKAALLRCLSSVAGIGALVAHLRLLLAKQDSLQSEKRGGNKLIIQDLITVLSSVLKPPDVLFNTYMNISSKIERPAQRQIMWKELISLLAAGKVLSVASEGLLTIKDLKTPRSIHWIGDGNLFASWLGRCISHMVSKVQPTDSDGWNYLAQFIARSLSLGYTAQVVSEIYDALLLQEDAAPDRFGIFLDNLRRHDQILIFKSILHDLERRFLHLFPSAVGSPLDDPDKHKAIGGVSAIVATIVRDRDSLKLQLSEWLVTGLEINIKGIDFRRALLASFGNHQEPILEILRRALEIFGDNLYIKHTPTRGQEANAQIILLTAGYAHRLCPHQLRSITQSGTYLTAISNRLAASSPRARFLGMIVGMSLSKLVDPADKAMKFDLEEMGSEEALWYMSLTSVKDEVGSIKDLKHKNTQHAPKKSKHNVRKVPQVDQPKSSQATSKVLSIEEISEESDVDDLLPYEKPDTDASDSEDDPTLINRSKPSAPVYIRDLLACLRDTDNAERYNLGISTAATLIRRKASFGTEVAENSEALALTIGGLQDKYNLPNFQEYKLQSEIALLVAYPLTMGQWFVYTLFNADLSQSQRSTILVALGLSARELAGFGKEDSDAMGLPPTTDSSFPSKRLPSNLETTYGDMSNPINAISKKLSQATLQPLALHAADSITGPNALKVRTFSSRMEVEKKKQQREQQRRQKAIPKDLHRILSDGFFFPLINAFGVTMYSTSSSKVHNPFLIPQLLHLFIQTVTLILSTLGPNSPNLATLTHEALALLITLHNLPVATEPRVLPAILSLFLAVVDLNISAGSVGEERLVTEFVTQVVEMREWVDGVFERASKEEEEVRMLSAGIMVKLGEVTDRYQGRLLGTNLGFGY